MLNVVGFTGQIGYALVPMIARGVMLGTDQPVILHMLDIPPAVEALNGVKMELIDAAFPLLKGNIPFFPGFENIEGIFLRMYCYLLVPCLRFVWNLLCDYEISPCFLFQVLLPQLMSLRHALESILQSWLVVSQGKKAWRGKM